MALREVIMDQDESFLWKVGGRSYRSGALPLLYEFPHGIDRVPFSHREIIDLGLTLFEEVMNYGLNYKFQPRFDNIFLSDYHKKQSKYIQEIIMQKM